MQWRTPAHRRQSPRELRNRPCQCGYAPRRADASRSCVCAFVHRKSRNSAGGQTRASKSGGVSPPWFHKCNCTDVRRPPAAVTRDFAEAFLQVRFPSHGGLTPAAPAFARDECPRTCAVSALQARFPNHGGLTPAALDVVRPPARVAFSCQCGSRLTAG